MYGPPIDTDSGDSENEFEGFSFTSDFKKQTSSQPDSSQNDHPNGESRTEAQHTDSGRIQSLAKSSESNKPGRGQPRAVTAKPGSVGIRGATAITAKPSSIGRGAYTGQESGLTDQQPSFVARGRGRAVGRGRGVVQVASSTDQAQSHIHTEGIHQDGQPGVNPKFLDNLTRRGVVKKSHEWGTSEALNKQWLQKIETFWIEKGKDQTSLTTVLKKCYDSVPNPYITVLYLMFNASGFSAGKESVIITMGRGSGNTYSKSMGGRVIKVILV